MTDGARVLEFCDDTATAVATSASIASAVTGFFETKPSNYSKLSLPPVNIQLYCTLSERCFAAVAQHFLVVFTRLFIVLNIAFTSDRTRKMIQHVVKRRKGPRIPSKRNGYPLLLTSAFSW